MRFPLSLTTNMIAYMARKKIERQPRFPLVLMLEPLHACNLTCTGCGRIREYESTIRDVVPLEKCLQAAEECGAPIVSERISVIPETADPQASESTKRRSVRMALLLRSTSLTTGLCSLAHV